MANTYTLISSYTVDASAPTSFSFTSIPQTYTDLKLVMSLRGSRTNHYSNVWVLVNGSTSAIYDYKIVYNNSGSALSTGATSDTAVGYWGVGSTATASTFSSLEIYYPNYTSSNYKSSSGDSVTENNSTDVLSEMHADLAKTTNPITSLTINGSGNNYTFAQYSTFYLYGIKNS